MLTEDSARPHLLQPGPCALLLGFYLRHPVLGHTREGFMHARYQRQAFASDAAIAAARKAQVVWQHYGE